MLRQMHLIRANSSVTVPNFYQILFTYLSKKLYPKTHWTGGKMHGSQPALMTRVSGEAWKSPRSIFCIPVRP